MKSQPPTNDAPTSDAPTIDRPPDEMLGEAIVSLADARQAGAPLDLATWFARYPADCHAAMHAHLADLGIASFVEAGSGRDTTRLASFGDYEILTDEARPDGKIAYGGVGAVFQARDRRLNRVLAIKVLRDIHRRNERVAARFVAEAQVAAQLQHPNIVPIYEVSRQEDGRPYFTMKLVNGRTLASLLDDATTPADRLGFLDIFEAICQTVAYAHTRGVLHRDLKPENIMVGAFGEVQVMDWGLAGVLRGDAEPVEEAIPRVDPLETTRQEATLDGQVMGTPTYMAPESARGERVDCRADVFCLGGILGTILTGRPPFSAGSLADEPRRRIELSESREAIRGTSFDGELKDLALACLEESIDARPANASAVAAAVVRYQKGRREALETAKITAVKAVEQAVAERKRRKWLAATALLGILLVVMGAMALHLRGGREAEKRAKEQNLVEAERFRLYHRMTSAMLSMYRGKEEKGRKEAREVIAESADLSARHPDDDACLELYALTNSTYAALLDTPANSAGPAGRLAPALAILRARPDEKHRPVLEEQLLYFDRAAELFQQLIDQSPVYAEAIQEGTIENHTIKIHLECGRVLGVLLRFTEALQRFDRVIPVHTDPNVKAELIAMRGGIVKAAEWEQGKMPWSRAPNADHAKAMRLGAYLAEAQGVTSAGVYNVACAFALAADEAGIAPEEKERRGAGAVGYLKRIAGEGYFRSPAKVRELQEDADLVPIRKRPDFAEVLRSARGN